MSDESRQSRPGSGPPRHRLLGVLDRIAFRFFGPPARQANSSPVVHRHDEVEEEIDTQLASVFVETDAEGHHYGVQRLEPRPVLGLQGNTYPYYAGRPPLNAPET